MATLQQQAQQLPNYSSLQETTQPTPEKGLRKTLKLTPDQSTNLHALICSLEELMNKVQTLYEQLEKKAKPDEKLVRDIADSIAKRNTSVANDTALIKLLNTDDVHRGNKELKTMFDNICKLLGQLEQLSKQLTTYQQTGKSEELIKMLQPIILLYAPIKQKLLDAIEFSSLVLDLPRKSVQDATKTAPTTVPDQPSRLEIKVEPNTLHKATLEDKRVEILTLIETETYKPVDDFDEQGYGTITYCLFNITLKQSAHY